ncbi:MAG: HEAT repeat domain-containing protein [Planctomycetota bacterium]
MAFRICAALALVASFAMAGDPPSAEDAKVKVAALKAAREAEAKKAAIADAGTCPHATVAAALAPMLADADDAIRTAAVEALGSMKGLADAARALAGGVGPNAKKPEVLKAVFAAIGKVGHATAIPMLKDFASRNVPMKDEKASDATVAAVNALAEIKSKASVEVLLDFYKKQVGIGMGCSAGIQAAVYSAISGGLKTLTGETFNSLPGEAELWWRKNKDKFNEDMTKK